MSAVNVTTQALLASPAVVAIVAQRINPGIGGATVPDLIVTRVSGGPTYGLARATPLTSSRIQIECRARSYTAAENLGKAVTDALKNRRGTFAGRKAVFQAAGSDYEDHADDASIFRRLIDFYVWDQAPV